MVHTLAGSSEAFFGKTFGSTWTWIEIGHLHISANTSARDFKVGTHLGGGDQFKHFLFKNFDLTCT